ncbi:MAG: FtsW/RodA/SpoVE family cell cycle protein [Bacteroidaceae bacterium]|nr:FtsW/RodA/SpoVE family cell cycle protein [Bacteroidaceae bacterium]MBQ9674991.1 FtsW/RodA/SpoVE family cell cycle protein [Bacteroidaceae bacterium]
MNLINSIFKGDKVIWMIFLMLCLISITEVFSASSTLTYGSQSHWGPITQHSILLMFGVFIVWFMHSIPYKWFRIFAYPLLLVSVIMLIVVMLMGFISGDRVNGAARWLTFFGVAFQPSELAKMAVIILTAAFLSKGQTEEGASPQAFKWILGITIFVCILIVPENYSTGALLFATVFLMMIIGRIQLKKIIMLGGSLGAMVLLFVGFLAVTPDNTLEQIPMGHRFTTVKHRLMNFGEERVPAAKYDIQGDGAQVAHARIAIATSNVIGKGPGNSVERDFLSQAYSDFIFAIIIEELGLVGGIFVVFLYICLLIRTGKIAQKCDRTFPAFLVLGIALLLVMQATFNMCVAVGLVPVTGQPLPLISKGGTSTWINCAYIGMILSVSRYTAKLEEERKAMVETATELNTNEVGIDEMDEAAETPMSESQTAFEPGMKEANDDTLME